MQKLAIQKMFEPQNYINHLKKGFSTKKYANCGEEILLFSMRPTILLLHTPESIKKYFPIKYSLKTFIVAVYSKYNYKYQALLNTWLTLEYFNK